MEVCKSFTSWACLQGSSRCGQCDTVILSTSVSLSLGSDNGCNQTFDAPCGRISVAGRPPWCSPY
jgi:hypothetical protein